MVKKKRATSAGDFRQRILSATRTSTDLRPWSLIVGVPEDIRSGMVRCQFRALYSGFPVLQRTDTWFLGERVLWQHSLEGPFVPMDPPVRMLRPDLLSTEDRAQAILGYLADQLVLPDASYPAYIASRLTPLPTFVPRVELRGWVPPSAEITYIDAVGSVIREILPAAEDDEGIPFVPETVESVPRETVNGMVRTLRAFRATYRRALVTLSCRDHRMIADVHQPSSSCKAP